MAAIIRTPPMLLKRLFENQSGSWAIVGSDGKVFKIHPEILSEQVPYFRAAFSHEGTTEQALKTIETPAELEMTGPALEAFLRYVYYQNVEGMKASLAVTSTLIRAGHYYDIPQLVNASIVIIQKMLQGDREWFNGEELWKLYQNVNLWEKNHASKKQVIGCIIDALKMFCKDDTQKDQLLPIVGGNPIARDLIVEVFQLQHVNVEEHKRKMVCIKGRIDQTIQKHPLWSHDYTGRQLEIKAEKENPSNLTSNKEP